ncbi:MAG TPA: PadR family transcriptional regulator [Micromonosporaceae bacterium]|nr:PadR family transcriptional regulator [Micromonosporaceae bacterium]
MPDDLPPTSYAVLGLLALRPWTGYELTQQARRSLAFCWPKEESVLYEEPRRLVARGLARSEKERAGGRVRNRYEITDEGRRVLREWLATSGDQPRPQFEPMLRLTFADQGDRSGALAAVATLREWAAAMRAEGFEILRDYQGGKAPFPERSHINVLNGYFYLSLYDAVLAFADLAEKEISTWERTDGLGMTDRTRELMDKLLGSQ